MWFRSTLDSRKGQLDSAARRNLEAFNHPPLRVRPQIEVLEQRRLCSANPAIVISDVALAEGQSGATAFVFTVSLSKACSKRVSVDFATADGSAVAGADYAQTSGTLVFARGETTKTVTVPVYGDTAVETDETFVLTLRRASNAFITDDRGVGTIINDDVPPSPPPAYEPPPEEYVEPYWGPSAWD